MRALRTVGAYPAALLDDRPDLADGDWFGTWLIGAAVMGA